MMLAIIMAGGRGVRLRPYTLVLPKPLLPYNGGAVIDDILSNLIKFGYDEFYFMLRYKNQLVKSYVEMNYPKISSKFIIEEEDGMGTCGGLSLLKDIIKDKQFLVMNADLITDIDYRDLYNQHKGLITVVTVDYSVKIPFGVVQGNKIAEKPISKFTIVAGVYMLSKEILDYIPKKFYNMNELLNSIKDITYYHHLGNYMDIGHISLEGMDYYD